MMHRRTLTSAAASQQPRAGMLPRRRTTAPSFLLPFPETRRWLRSSAIARARRRASDFEPEAPPDDEAGAEEEQFPSKTARRRKARAVADADDADALDANETTSTTTAALRKAVRLVDYRERSSGELLRRLRESSFPESDARQAVERLEASGLVDDRRFADLLVARRWRSRAEAPRAIRQALMAAGVPREVGEEALEAFFGGDVRVVRPYDGGGEEEDEEEDDEEDGARSRWRALVAAAREQARRSASAEPEKRRARLYRWLAARGHSHDTVSAVVREVGL